MSVLNTFNALSSEKVTIVLQKDVLLVNDCWSPFAARVHNRVRGVLYRPDSAYYGCNMKQHPVYCSGMHQVASVSEFCVHTSIRMPNSVTRHPYMQLVLGAHVFEKLCCTSK